MSSALTLVKDFVGEIPRPLYGACVFCGDPCYGRACQPHHALLYLDGIGQATRVRKTRSHDDPYTIARGGAAA